ncbi:MAG: PaaI family thioesterase [Pseudomonadota bacterium]
MEQSDHNALIIDQSGCQSMVGFVVDLSDARITRCYLDIGPQHLNRQNMVHGGISAMMLDVACGYAASAWFDPDAPVMVLTVSLNTMFVAPVNSGRITASAVPTGGGRKLVYVSGELRDADENLIASATGVFKRSGDARV